MTQTTINFERPVPAVDPNIHPGDVSRVTGQSAAVLERLRLGPATNIELGRICMRYSARVHDLKRAGYRIRSQRVEGAVWSFWIEAK